LVKRIRSIVCLEIAQHIARYPTKALVTKVDGGISQNVKFVNSDCHFDGFVISPWRKENFASIGPEVLIVGH